jgi:hypothetical protein
MKWTRPGTPGGDRSRGRQLAARPCANANTARHGAARDDARMVTPSVVIAWR